MSNDWHELVSQPKYQMKVTRDIFAPTRDGVKLAVDVYAPDAPGRFPVLLSWCCYGKDVQKLPVTWGPIDFMQGNGGIEAGDSEFFVSRGYIHVIAEARGTGLSKGDFRVFTMKEQEDCYDLIEWVARQPWCDGNVGMLGMSYFGMMQYLVAALNPPHLKAIFAADASTDYYRQFVYHGGILNYGFFFHWWAHMPVHTIAPLNLPDAEVKSLVERAKNDLDVQGCPVAYVTLGLPEKNIPLFDALIHPNDGPYYWERSAYTKFDKIRVPTYLLSRWTGWNGHLPGAFSAYLGINAPKKLHVGPTELGGSFGRPWRENHDLILRWYDHWLKGMDTGIMTEPPISVFVQGEDRWRFEQEWPLAKTKWTPFYLRGEGRLSEEPPPSHETPDSFTSVPRLWGEQEPPHVTYATAPLATDMEVTGPVALYLHAALNKEDGNWMAEIHDVAPDGAKRVVLGGWLKASHGNLTLPSQGHTSRFILIPETCRWYPAK